MGNDDSRLAMRATRLMKSWWQQRAIRPFLVALVIAPLVGGPCPFGYYFDKRTRDIWGVGGLTEAPAPGQHKSATAWETNGPYGGPVRFGLAIDPVHPGTIYAASSGGVFKSTDAGATWALSAAGITDMTEIHSVAVDPANPAIVYAGSTDSVDALFKSTDAGANWTKASTGLFSGTVYAIAIDPAHPSTLYVGSSFGIWRSTDGAANWVNVTNGIGSKTVVALAIDPLSTSTVYAMTRNSGVYKSTNGGIDWSPVNSGFAASGSTILTAGIGLAIDPALSSRLYAGGYRSTDGGASWTPMTGLGQYVTSLAVDPQAPSTLYAGDDTGGAYKSSDSGASWTKINTGLFNLTIWSVAIDPQSPATLYAASDYGIYKSTDAGLQWAASNQGLANTDVQAVVIDPFVPAIVYAGTTSNGIFRSSDSGASWTNVLARTPANSIRIMGMAVDPRTPGTLYAASYNGPILKSTDRGTNWTSVRLVAHPVSVAVDPFDAATVYVGTLNEGVFKSVDRGATFAQVNNGLPHRPNNAALFGGILGIAVSPKDRSVWAWVQVADGEFTAAISRDGGVTWSESYPGWNKSAPLGGPSLLDFLTRSVGFPSISANFLVPQYADQTTCLPIAQVIVDPFDSSIGYASGACGVGRAKYANGDLVPMPLPAQTPPWVVANALAITPNGSDLYAGMQWGGVYKLALDPAPKVVVEYHLANADHYFITAEPAEQAAVDGGAAGPFLRTGGVFRAGGSTPVCRFFGNTNINPATGAFYGPNSHFYTADAAECALLKSLFAANAKAWNFESNDFLTTPAAAGQCPANMAPVYRAYNNGFALGVDSNHRITADPAAYQAQVAAGWIGEGIVMCAPR